MIEKLWNTFIEYLKEENSEIIKKINPPATAQELEKVKMTLGPLFHEDLQKIYGKANGFVEEAYLLTDDYRILPLNEMMEKSLELIGEVLTLDHEAGEFKKIDKLKIVIFAVAKKDNEDIEQVGFSLRKGKTNVVIWYKEGGIHGHQEVVYTSETLEEWFGDVLEYYS